MGRAFRIVTVSGLFLALVGPSGCGGSKAKPDAPQVVADGAAPDAAPPDAPPPVDAIPDAQSCPRRDAGAIGGACKKDTDCASSPDAGDGLCASAGIGWPPGGYCSRFCTGGTACGPNNFCATVTDVGQMSSFQSCFPSCCAGSTCPSGQICGTRPTGYLALDKPACIPGKAGAKDGDPCSSIADCADSSTCSNNGVEDPGGSCHTVGCTVGTDSSCNGGHCVDYAPGNFGLPFCVKTCQSNADCRMSEGYRCIDETSAGLGKFCWHARVGDPCAKTSDCGVSPWECLTQFQGGLCTVPCTVGTAGSCPGGRSCYDPGSPGTPFCVDKCVKQSDCRTGYTCTPIPNDKNNESECVPN